MLNLSRCRIIAIGKIRKPWIQEGINLYLKRLPALSIKELRDGDIGKESIAIQSSIKSGELLITLAEDGERFNSLSFSKFLNELNSERIVFAIGGPNGLSPQIKAIAHHSLSLSAFTFPHEIARLILVEQIYRASTIIQGGSYHRA